MPKRQTGARPLAEGAAADIYKETSTPATDERPVKEQDAACYQAAVRLLSHRARSEAEMRQRLKHKQFEPATIERILGRLKESGLLDDEAFARAWSDSRAFGSPRASRVIRLELRSKGIAAQTAEEAIVGLDDAESAYKAGISRVGRLTKLPPAEARRKLADFLRRRGFNWEIIDQTLKRLESEKLLDEVDTN